MCLVIASGLQLKKKTERSEVLWDACQFRRVFVCGEECQSAIAEIWSTNSSDTFTFLLLYLQPAGGNHVFSLSDVETRFIEYP